MRAHILQHVPFEDSGSITPWLKAADYRVTTTKFYQSTSLPDPGDIDLLIIMGGPMSVNDEDQFPWLRLEKKFIRQSIKSNKAVLGICLGAQLIASALGESVYLNRRKEIGWFAVQSVIQEDPAIFSLPSEVKVFHWHGETFDLPDEAVLLARSEACEHQAFQVGERVIGLQFHLETTPQSVQAIVTNCRQEILPSMFVQPEALILDQPPETYKVINELMDKVLHFLTKNLPHHQQADG